MKVCRTHGTETQDGICPDCETRAASHKCAYADNGQYCPLIGTIANTVKTSEHTQWYCIYHFNYFDNPRAASENLTGILSGDLQLKPFWKTEALHNQAVEIKKSNPEIFITDATSDEIAEVNMSLIRQMRTLETKLPYKKSNNLSGKGYAEDSVLEGLKELTEADVEQADVSKYQRQA